MTAEEMDKFVSKDDGNEYYTFNITLGISEEPPYLNGANIIPWRLLNDYNKRTLADDHEGE